MHILIIEEEEYMATAIAGGLEAEGFTVDTALAGTDGLRKAREGPYDLIVLDVLFPGGNGFEICTTLRTEGNWVPVVMLAAQDGEFDEAEALDSGADDFLSKPFVLAVLAARIRALVRRGRRKRPSILTAGDLTLDPAEHWCRRGQTVINLTLREFSLLEYLLRFAGAPVSKRDIMADVWGDGFEGDPNIVEVYVGYLRRKIDRPFNRNSVETVRGIGYRLAADGG